MSVPCRCCHAAAIPQPRFIHATGMPLPCRCHAAAAAMPLLSLLCACRCHDTDMWLPCCCLAAVMPMLCRPQNAVPFYRNIAIMLRECDAMLLPCQCNIAEMLCHAVESCCCAKMRPPRNHAGTTSQQCSRHVCAVSLTCYAMLLRHDAAPCKHVATMLQPHRSLSAAMPLHCRRHVVAPCCCAMLLRHAANMSQPCCCCVAAMVLPCRCHNAAMLQQTCRCHAVCRTTTPLGSTM